MHIQVGKILTQLRTREIDHEIDYFLYQKRDLCKSEAHSPNGEGKYGIRLQKPAGGTEPCVEELFRKNENLMKDEERQQKKREF